ncbi:MAG: S1C family serine protease, partial [Pyrobaculum sp.]
MERSAPSVVGVVTRQLDFYSHGVGSAFSIGGGLFATALHVVEAAGEVAVVTPEGEVAEAVVVAIDPQEDLALLYSELRAPPLPLGSALRLRVGETVVALGYPLALLDRPTATFGIVSAVGRSLQVGERRFEFLIQTDAAINPGNSGGPLVNARGEAVGVNSSIIAGAQGIGFAVPIDLAKIMAEMVAKYGRYVRPALGVYVAAINKALASLYRLPVDRGLLVVDVQPGSPAEEVGIMKGDVITKVNNVPTTNVFELRLQLAESRVRGK